MKKPKTPKKPKSPPNPARLNLARYIINKYVVPDEINWPRDMTIALKLADKFPCMKFWEYLKVKKQIVSMVMLWTEKCKAALKREHAAYQTMIEQHRNIKIDEAEPKYIIGDKVGEDAEIVKKPTLRDFLKDV